MNRTKTGSLVSKKSNHKQLYWLIALLLISLAVYFALIPLRRDLAQRFVDMGDSHLDNREYVEAVVDYKKANFLDDSSQASSKISLSEKAQQNILELKMFLRESNNLSTLDLLNSVQKVPTSQKEGLEQAKDLIENNEPQLAEVSCELLLEMDKGNKEVWLYLGMARLQSARIVQMNESNRSSKLQSAKEAFAEANKLDTSDELAKKYLSEVESLL